LQSMFQCPSLSPRQWGDMVHAAAPEHLGPWPRISVWHGSDDKTVVPANAREIVKQWTSLHGLPVKPTEEDEVEGHLRQVWRNGAGDAVIESYTIANMAHGTPLATGDADSECGNAGPFLLEAGISSSFHIAGFFGLAAEAARTASQPERASTISQIRKAILPKRAARPITAPSLPDVSDMPRRASSPHAYPVDIGAVITDALQAAGLMKK
jgi:hypothetical protein